MEYSIDDILKAKEIVRNAGYGVSLPDNKLDIAKNIAKANGYTVRKNDTANADDINQALRIATDAGYTVRKNINVQPQVKPETPTAPATPAEAPTAPATPAAPEKPASTETPAAPVTPVQTQTPAETPAPATPEKPTSTETPAAPVTTEKPAYEPSWVEKIASRYV